MGRCPLPKVHQLGISEENVMGAKEISVAEFYKLYSNNDGVLLIDVRTPGEFQSQHVPNSKCIPLDEINREAIAEHQRHPEQPVYLICRSGNRSGMALRKLSDAEFAHAVSISGGIVAWQQAGYPVNTGAKKVMALDRQVRITAGALAAAGTLLGLFVSQWFFVIPAGIGCGLVYSGLTDTCAMGAALAKMPWNRGIKGDCHCG
jgi:rhodanese-related sulfurtransferase